MQKYKTRNVITKNVGDTKRANGIPKKYKQQN